MKNRHKEKTGRPANPKTSRPASAKGFERTRRDHRNELAEDYVELIGELIRERGEARAVDIARRLGVSHVTVSRTIQRLREAGFVTADPYRSIFLTDSGRRMAEQSRLRHEQVMAFLLALGVPHEIAAIDSEGLEHHVSDVTLDVMRRYTEHRSRVK